MILYDFTGFIVKQFKILYDLTEFIVKKFLILNEVLKKMNVVEQLNRSHNFVPFAFVNVT